MRAVKIGFVVAAMTCLAGASTPARACDLSGTFLCANDPSIAVAGETIDFTLLWSQWEGQSSFSVVTDGSGNISAHVGWQTEWEVTYFGTLTCGENGRNYLGIVYVPESHPQCTPIPACPVALPSQNLYCPSRPLGNPRAECESIGLVVLDKDDATSGATWTATTDARVAIVKAGGCYRYMENVKAGDSLPSPSGQGISHVTYCACPDP